MLPVGWCHVCVCAGVGVGWYGVPGKVIGRSTIQPCRCTIPTQQECAGQIIIPPTCRTSDDAPLLARSQGAHDSGGWMAGSPRPTQEGSPSFFLRVCVAGWRMQ